MDINNLLRDNIRMMQSYASARNEFDKDDESLIFLDANESPFDNGINRYPDPLQKELKGILSQFKDVDPDQILLGNGSDEVLDLLFRAFCEPNRDNVITLPPTYGMYNVLANLNAVEDRKVFLGSDFKMRLTEIMDNVDQFTKLIFLCCPNNPTGNPLCNDMIIQLLEKFQGLVVVDEAYIDFSCKESLLNRLDEFPNLVVTQTLSKAFGMAGIRLGILFASKEIIAVLNKIKPPYNINTLTQKRAKKELLKLKEINVNIKLIIKERDRLIKEFLQINFIKKVHQSEANFILIEVDNANLRYQQLLDNKIVVRNRTKEYGLLNCLRISIGTPAQNTILIDTLKNL
ncbi:histidinol-phosphate transaminase [Flavobacterium sp.]|uniref:histidinol-phosphate transaminase n=1 Tax=Flavobacterium sp. TaxID=239 RepID=UPI003D0AADC7